MKQLFLVCLCLACVLPLEANIVVDHTCTDLAAIPSATIDAIQTQIKLHYAHTSHGSQLTHGITYIESSDPSYDVTIGYSYLPTTADSLCIFDGQESQTYITPELYWDGASALNNTRSTLDNNPTLNVSMWSWCCQMDYSDSSYVQAYLDAMTQLESEYPGVTFVYLTGNAQGTGSSGYTRYQNNEMIRSYCQANNKVLFDFADLDCWWYNPVSETWEHSTYTYNTEEIPCEHPQYNDSGGPGHTTAESCTQKGKALWWLMSLLTGGSTEPDIAVAPSSYDYGTLDLTSYLDHTFTISNSGSDTLNVTGQTILGHSTDFTIQSGGGTFSLAPGNSHETVVRFEPTVEGARSATLRVASNDPDENPFDVSLDGSGAAAGQLHTPVAVYPHDYAQRTSCSILLQWTDTNSAPQETGMQLRYRLSGGAYTFLDLSAGTTWCSLSGLSPGSTYQWSVRAVDDSKATSSNWTQERSFSTAGSGDGSFYLPFVLETADYRSNVGFSNFSATQQSVQAYLYDCDGILDAGHSFDVPAYSYTPAPSIIDLMGGSNDYGHLVMSAPDAMHMIGGPVDNLSSDPSVTALATQGYSEIITPIVLKSGPWATEVVIQNPTDSTAGYTIDFFDATTPGAAPSHSLIENIPGKGHFIANDIIDSLGADPGDYGMLRVSTAGQAVGYCHQYTDSHTGGIYPFFSPTEAERLFYFPYVEDTANFRSNVGLLNIQSSDVNVTLSFYAAGSLDATRSIGISPNQYYAVNDVIRFVRNLSAMQNTNGLLVVEASAPILAIGGCVDNTTSDPAVHGGQCGQQLTAYTPIVLKSGGWKTMVVISNFTNTTASVTIQAKNPQNGDVAAEISGVMVPAKMYYKTMDIVASLSLSEGFYGRLELSASQPVAGFVYQYTPAGMGGIYPFLPTME